jgi:hypothetical protein
MALQTVFSAGSLRLASGGQLILVDGGEGKVVIYPKMGAAGIVRCNQFSRAKDVILGRDGTMFVAEKAGIVVLDPIKPNRKN